MNIPIIVICYNNYKYVENTLKQINKINEEYFKNIYILDNCSTDIHTINYLKSVNSKVIYNKTNEGPWIEPNINSDIYDILPERFILTDADLEFNDNLPPNFIEILSNLSDLYLCKKIGFALDINDFAQMYDYVYAFGQNIYEWELRHWTKKIQNNYYELYDGLIDTTFSLINKKNIDNYNYMCIRIAGNFTAKHIPWYKNNKIINVYDNYLLTNFSNLLNTTSKVIGEYIANEYLKINKNNEFFFIKNNDNDKYLNFWKNDYSKWKSKTFVILDKFLNKNQIFIDIGGFIGTTCMYGIRKSKHVYCIESDATLFEYMSLNCQNNCDKNYTLINNNIDNIDKLDTNLIKSITIQSIIDNYNINPNEISLINIDISGREENILNDLYNLHKLHNIPLYINFYYGCWNDKNLDRFIFLSEHDKVSICNNNCIDILFM